MTPSAEPVPLQTEQFSIRGAETSFSQPKAASSKVSSSRDMTFSPRWGTFCWLPRLLPPEPTTQPPTTVPPTTEIPTEPTLPPPEASPYTFTDFQYNGRYLTCLATETLLGLDVSAHQEEIDWQAVAAAGFEFVMIRVGYRGYETGLLQADAYAQANYAGAKAAGLKVGAYMFSQAISRKEAMEEARFALEQIRGWELDLPLVYDWERVKAGTRTDGVDARTVTDCALGFCALVEAVGKESMVYFNPHHGKNYFYLHELEEYPFWLAYYTDKMDYPYKFEMWQYTDSGNVPGIEGGADINIMLLPWEA